MREKLKVFFSSLEKEVEVEEGENLLEIAKKAGVHLNNFCGGKGLCGKCKLIIRQGKIKSEPSSLLTEEESQKGYILACQTVVYSNVKVDIPLESQSTEDQILVSSKAPLYQKLYSKVEKIESQLELEEKRLFTHSPLATKLFLKMPPPTLKDNISDLERLYREIRSIFKIPIMQTGLSNVRKLGALFRENNFQVTVTLGKRNGTVEIVQIEPQDTSSNIFGVAIDIGTTTVVTQLVNLNTEEIISTNATYNQQRDFGEDVISRIIYASEKKGLIKLNQAIVDNINSLISISVKESKINLNDVLAIMCAGNMTMIQLLLGVEPTYLRQEPYVPTANFMPVIRCKEVGIKINPRGLLACLPGVGSYVGGDISAGIIACGMEEIEEVSLLIDIGTNGEIVLGNKGWLVCCSSSAGPAFEGSGVRCGIRAVKGAIQKVEISKSDFKVDFQTIGGEKPKGICGAGLIDLLAEMLKVGIIDRAGKIKKELNSSRIRREQEGLEFIVVFAKDTAIEKDIVIRDIDIINLIRSKAAIYAAIEVLTKHMGVNLEEIEYVFIAGGFGNYINIKNAIFIGLLPDLPLEKFRFVGNSSLTGARLALLSYDALGKVRQVAQKMTCLELSVDNKFMNEYVKALFLPHTEIDLFPTVKKNLERL